MFRILFCRPCSLVAQLYFQRWKDCLTLLKQQRAKKYFTVSLNTFRFLIRQLMRSTPADRLHSTIDNKRTEKNIQMYFTDFLRSDFSRTNLPDFLPDYMQRSTLCELISLVLIIQTSEYCILFLQMHVETSNLGSYYFNLETHSWGSICSESQICTYC